MEHYLVVLVILRGIMLAAVLGIAAAVDVRKGIIPNRLLLAGALFAFILRLPLGVEALGEGLGAGLTALGLLLAVRFFSALAFGRIGLGMGDVKLAGVLGLYLGWSALWALYLAAVIGGLFGAGGLLIKRLSRATRLPFAPFMAAGALLHVFILPPL